jgi:Tfp pilus assembly protein PilO
MEKLNALTAAQKLLIGLAVLGIAGVAFWQLVITDAEAAAGQARTKVQKLQQEYGQLKEYEKKSRLDEVKAKRAEVEARLEELKKLLPPEDEIPTFIMSIKAMADASGLQVEKFEPLDPEIEDYYRKVPVKVEVLGKASDLLDFLQTLAGPKKLIVNVREIEMKRLQMDVMKIQEELGEESHFDKAARFKRQKKEERDMTNEERRMLKLQRWQLANEMNKVRASFVAYTFVYTGEQMPEEARKKKQRKQRRRG